MDNPQNTTISRPFATVEFCAGYQGIHLGLKRAIPNLRVIAVSEIEAFAAANLVAKMEVGLLDSAPVWPDLKTFPNRAFYGKVDLLVAGFPCQPFSAAGKRGGDEDPRHLFPYIKQSLIDMQPEFVFLENVEGIISSKLSGDSWADPAGTPVLLHVLRELERVGYRATAGVFSASEVGAPHQRKRVFILGHRKGDDERRPPKPSMHWEGVTTRGSGRSELADSHSILRRTPTEGRVDDSETGPAGESLANGDDASPPRLREVSWEGGPTSEEGVWSGPTERCWPARPGEQQYDWEPPRVVGNSKNADQGQRVEGEQGQEGRGRDMPSDTSQGQTQPTMGRDADGLTDRLDHAELYESCDNRTDELRLLGNGVVPATAERAWNILSERLNHDHR